MGKLCQGDNETENQAIAEVSGSRPGSVLRASNCANLDAEKLLTGFGTFGLYQMFVYVMANIGFFLYAGESMIISLIMQDPEFICTDPEAVALNETLGVCEYFSSSANVTVKCSNFEYLKGKHEYFTSEFGLICDRRTYGEHSVTIFMIGSMICTPILTQLADLYGRRVTYLIPLWLAVLASIGCAFSPNYLIFMICRFIAGVGTAGVGTIGFVIMLETIAPAFRSLTPFVSTIVWVAGYTTVGIVHIYIKSWRWQFFVLVAPFLLTISYYWLLPESIHWMITYKKHKDITSYVKRSSRFNRKELDLEKCKSSQPEDFNSKKRTFVDLFTNGPLLFQLFSHCIIMIVMNFTYWALSLFSTDLHENEMIGYFLSGFVELPAALTVFLLVYFGRRTVTAWSLLAQSAFMFVAVFYPGQNFIAMTLFLSVKLFNSVAWVAEPLLVGEMSPTTTRNMFYGVVGFVGEIGSIIAPYFNHLKTIHDAAPAFAVALMSLLAGLLALCSPETKDMPMPEDINDFDPGPVYRWIFGKKSKNNTENNKNIIPLLDPIPEEPTEFEK